MSEPIETPQRGGGIADSLRGAIRAGLVCGFLFGLVDAIAAALVGTAQLDLVAWLGCLAATVLQYGVVATVALGAVALVLHRWIQWRERGDRALLLLRIGLAVGLFAEIYWWTRPLVYYGRPALSNERLLATAAMLAVAVGLAYVLGYGLARLSPRKQRALAAVIGVSWIGGALFLLAQGSASGSRGEIGERNREQPNVLLVIVDALRQDALGCYGNREVQTPAIDTLALQGVVFENAFVQAPFTWPSFGSILTGKYPRRHGLVKMAAGVRMAPNITLPHHLKTAQKKDGAQMTDDDYVGATFHTGTLSTGSGLLRGFDMYFEALAGHDVVAVDSLWSVFRSDLLLYLFKSKIEQKLHANLLVERARAWIGAHADRRFVAMVHLYATHTPYDPEPKYREQYVDPEYDGPIDAFYAQYRESIEAGRYAPTEADLRQIRALYHGGVTQADAEIGVLLDELDRHGIRDDTLVIVTADHGESLGEQGLWEHNHMVQTNLRVPLVICWPGKLPAGRRVPALIDEIDILPTVCDLAGIHLPREEGEYGIVDGKSLVPLVHGEQHQVREFSFAENGQHLSVQDLRHKLVVARELFEAGDPRANWDRALAGELAKPRLYDLDADPAEDHDCLAAARDRAEQLFEALVAWDASMPIRVPEVVPSDRDREQQRIRLNALGYTEDGIGSNAPPPPHALPARPAQPTSKPK